MAKKRSGRYTGVYTQRLSNGDVAYYFSYRNPEELGADGRPKLKWVKVGLKSGGITEVYTHQKRMETLNALRLGEDVPIKHKKRKRFTFQQGFDDYLTWARQNKKSWERDKSLWELHIAPTLGNRELTSLTRKDFERLRDEKLKTLSPRSVEYMLAVARQVVNHVVDDEIVKGYQNPIRKRSGQAKKIMPKVNNAKEGFLSYRQARKLLAALKEEHTTAYRFAVLMLFTGARFDEVSRLTWREVDLDNGLLHIKPSKNGNPRKVAITPPVLEILEELRDGVEDEQAPVIPNSQGKRWERMPKQFQQIADRVFPKNKTAGKHRITPHALRHTHASWMAADGSDLLQIKEQLGHKKLDMTLRYAHLIPDRRHDETRKIAEKFMGGEG